MTGNDFLEHFATLADAPGGILKLRELILQLAIEGKLVPQDPTDESADQLLERIQDHNTGKKSVGRQRKTRRRREEAKAVQLPMTPASWRWTKVDDIAEIIRGVSYVKSVATSSQCDGNIPILRANNIQTEINYDNLIYVPKDLISDAQFIKTGDLLVAMSSGSKKLVGKAAQARSDYEGAFGAFCGLIRPVGLIDVGFFAKFFQSPLYRDEVSRRGKGIGINNLQRGDIGQLDFPLPPLPEQKRIVAKVDRLMALCDALEAQQQARHAVRSRLHATLLGNLQTAANAADFARAWQRLRDHFAELFTPGEAALDAVAQLRQTILQLAVQGKLVPQDAKDEPVEKLLKQISDDGERNSINQCPDQLESPFQTPATWRWLRLSDMTTFGPRNGVSIKAVDYPTAVKTLTLTATTSGVFKPECFKYLDIEVEADSDLWLQEDDLLIQRSNTPKYVGVSAAFTGPSRTFIYPDLMMKIRMTKRINAAFVLLAMNSAFCRGYLRDRAVGTSDTMIKINKKTVESLPIPLPPLAEQQRIVAKVQQLMAQCDALEASLKAAATVSERWSAAAVRQLLEANAERGEP